MKKLLLVLLVLLPISVISHQFNFGSFWNRLDFSQPEVIKFYIKKTYPDIQHYILKTIEKESSFNIHAKNKNSSAIGLMQVTKTCAKGENFDYKEISVNPIKNIECGVSYLRKCLKKDKKNYYHYYKNGLGSQI
jgi:soluble lytic murein transglycosylase-like protein